jgi:hypothetical protein
MSTTTRSYYARKARKQVLRIFHARDSTWIVASIVVTMVNMSIEEYSEISNKVNRENHIAIYLSISGKRAVL